MEISDKIGIFELYNFAVHQIYILWYHQYDEINLKIFPIHFS